MGCVKQMLSENQEEVKLQISFSETYEEDLTQFVDKDTEEIISYIA